ncbi:MAG: hypothetical protein CVV08_16235 [Gammaproteobacteria bacterium HGW-Gammaproteobacteria-12]|nr:MAG: hypothetical protein CVV08_16235 [Gammaproteobacteria bacterium HGW-Gammaproteobacteria-12]
MHGPDAAAEGERAGEDGDLPGERMRAGSAPIKKNSSKIDIQPQGTGRKPANCQHLKRRGWACQIQPIYRTHRKARRSGLVLQLSRSLKNVSEAASARQKQAKKRSLRAVNEHFDRTRARACF